MRLRAARCWTCERSSADGSGVENDDVARGRTRHYSYGKSSRKAEVGLRRSRIAASSLALSALALSGCAYFRSSSPPPERPSAQFITADEIARSGATNAWELLRIRARAYEFTEDRYGRPRFIRTRRGRSTLSMSGADAPMIVVDGARLIDLPILRDISTGAIESVELLNGIAGTATQGTNASAGVIYIHTWEASQRSGG